MKYWYVWVGVSIYALILITTFLDVYEVFYLYAPDFAKWSAAGVALGLDLLVFYFSVISVLYPSKESRIASYTGGFLVWFVVLASMIDLWKGFRLSLWTVIGFISSLFIPLGSLMLGRVIGATIRIDSSKSQTDDAVRKVIESDLPEQEKIHILKEMLTQRRRPDTGFQTDGE